jgi:hypothetical protein
MNPYITILLLAVLAALAARGQTSFSVDGEELLPRPAPPVSRAPLHMAGLAGERLQGGPEVRGCVGGTWKLGAAALPPVLAVTPLDAAAIRDLQNLRALLHGVARTLAEERADRVFTDMPIVRGPHGYYRDNSVKRSPRDIEAAGERATQRAAQALEKFMRTPGRRLVAVRTDGTFVSPALASGDYLLCGFARPRDPRARAGLAPGLGVWWTVFTLGPHEQMRYALDETNMIGWDSIFAGQ